MLRASTYAILVAACIFHKSYTMHVARATRPGRRHPRMPTRHTLVGSVAPRIARRLRANVNFVRAGKMQKRLCGSVREVRGGCRPRNARRGLVAPPDTSRAPKAKSARPIDFEARIKHLAAEAPTTLLEALLSLKLTRCVWRAVRLARGPATRPFQAARKHEPLYALSAHMDIC